MQQKIYVESPVILNQILSNGKDNH